MDTQDRPAGVRGPGERLSVNSREIDSEKEPTSVDNGMDPLRELIHQLGNPVFCKWAAKTRLV